MGSERPAVDLVIPAFFLNLEDGHWWEFQDTATGRTARVECHGPEGDLTVKIALGDQVTEQHFEVRTEPDVTGEPIRQFTLMETRIPALHLAIQWPGGLALPAKWGVGNSLSATSPPGGDPLTGNPVRLTATLAMVGQLRPPAPPLFGIEIRQTLTDVGLNRVIGRADMFFAGSRGLVYATGDASGPPFVLKSTRWYGGS